MAKIPIHSILEKTLGISKIDSKEKFDALLKDKEKLQKAVDEINKISE